MNPIRERRLSRRCFLAGSVAAGIEIRIDFLPRPVQATLIDKPYDTNPPWIGPSGRPRFRIDAVAKVTGYVVDRSKTILVRFKTGVDSRTNEALRKFVCVQLDHGTSL